MMYLFISQPALSCNPRFPILNYSLSIPSVLERNQLNLNAEQDQGTLIVDVEVPGLESNRIFEVFIETCILITCRQSGLRVLSEWVTIEGGYVGTHMLPR